MSLVLICTASGVERRACALGLARSDSRDRFEVLKTGVGLEAARATLQKRLEGGSRPERIISTGFAGSLDQKIPLGAWAWSTGVAIEGKSPIPTPPPPPELLQADLSWIATHFTSSPVVVHAGESESARGAVDMESFAWAQVAQEHGIPFHIIRLISDTPERPLPRAIQKWATCALEKNLARRFRLAAQGAAEAGRDPRELSRFLVRSTRLLKALSIGWSTLGRVWPAP